MTTTDHTWEPDPEAIDGMTYDAADATWDPATGANPVRLFIDDDPQVAAAARVADLIAGLRALADECEARPELGALLAVEWMTYSFSRFFAEEAEFADAVRALGGRREKDAIGSYLEVSRRFGDFLKVDFNIARGKVCDAVEVGRESVEVPDPNAPKVTVDRPIIEWRCRPILEADGSSAITEVAEAEESA